MQHLAEPSSAASAPAAPQGRESPAAIALIFAALGVCFAVTCFTNDVVLGWLRALLGRDAGWPDSSARAMVDASGDYYEQYWLGSLKAAAFFGGLLVLGWKLRASIPPLLAPLKCRRPWIEAALAAAVAMVFLFAVTPNGMGRAYGYISVDPFVQHQGYYHRRILLPAVAYLLHLNGALWALFSWAITLSVLVLTRHWLELRGLVLTRLEAISLFTTGVLGGAIAMPGYPEIAVLGLTLVALLAFARTGRAGVVQAICFGLGLLTHESATVIAFGTLALTVFPRRLWPWLGGVLALYVAIWLASYAFRTEQAVTVQLAGGSSNFALFLQTLPKVGIAVLTTAKLTLLAVPVAIAVHLRAGHWRQALLIAMGLTGAAALTAVATDYSRMVSFGTFALLFALPVAMPGLSPRTRMALALINLALPTLYVAARHDPVTYQGLYQLTYGRWLGLPGD